ncbi:MAG: hypothetical protein EPO68_14875 [Planctomycetota bacterium]|nr:MAG: hypothetical protein EPO68_14875 [Planctomycetota bacterium]
MGKELDCNACFDWLDDGKALAGRAFLETDEIRFRRADGERGVRVKLAEFTRRTASAGKLVLARAKPAARAEFRLGAAAAADWLARIESPPSLCAKLGAKPGVDVRVHGALDAAVAQELDASGAAVKRRGAARLNLLEARALADFARAASLAADLAPGAHLWVIYPKGRRDMSESALRSTLLPTGLRDTKTCRVSDVLTALRFSKPVE